MQNADNYVHALRFEGLNRFFDLTVKLTTREQAFKAQLVNLIDPSHTHSLADIACGTGTLALAIKTRYPMIEVTGVDGDADMLNRAKTKASLSQMDIHWQQALAQVLPFEDNSLDAVTSTLFFHHLDTENKQAAFEEIRRVLRPNGKLYIADWGATKNPLLRTAFYLVQLLDGFETTTDNIEGRLPDFIKASDFNNVRVHNKLATPLGSIDIIEAKKLG